MKGVSMRQAGAAARVAGGIIWILVAAACWHLTAGMTNDNTAGETTLPATSEAIDAAVARLKIRLQEYRSGLHPSGSNELANAVASASLSETDHLASQIAAALSAQIRSLERLKEIRKLNEDRASEAAAWQGFSIPPPYPISMVESLRNELAAQRSEEELIPMLAAIHERNLARLTAELNESRKELRVASSEAEASITKDPGERDRIKLAEQRVHSQETMIEAMEMERLVALKSLEGQHDRVAFLERKLAAAESNTRFSKEDLDEILERVQKMAAKLQDDLNQAIASDVGIRQELENARALLRRAEENAAGKKGAEIRLSELMAALNAAQAEADTSEIKMDVLRGFIHLAGFNRTAWEDRFWAAGDRTISELAARQKHYRHEIAGWMQWKTLLEKRLSASVAESLRYAIQATDSKISAGEQQSLQKARSAVDARTAQYQQALVGLASAEAVSRRLDAELEDRILNATVGSRIQHGVSTAGSFLQRLWRTELYIAEDSTIANGQKISIPRSITLGMTVIALAIFVAGLLAARQASHWTAGLALRLFHTQQQTADLLAQTTGAGVTVTALLVAMASVRIPWTVFAFVGGALAIGIGLGAQALVNNFISGLILLFERSIRVGDIVEVESQVGKIIRIGARNSIIKRGDSVDVLVPNSQFLEKTVVNWTLTDDLVRHKISIGAAYGSDPRLVTKLIAQAASEHPQVVQHPAAKVLFDDFGDNALLFTLEFWMRLHPQADGGAVRSELRHRIHTLLTESGIVLAFPQRDVHIDSAHPIDVRVIGPDKPHD